jgi:HD-like signal output (HDOD) protein
MDDRQSTASLDDISCEPAVDALVRDICIPPRPDTLVAFQREMAGDDPDSHRLAKLVTSDIALTAALLKVANSPLYAPRRKCETVDQCLRVLGLRQTGTLLTGIMLRKALRADGPRMTRFWDVSGKRAHAMATLARGIRSAGIDPDVAQIFGLFCDVGIPLLMQRFEGYTQTLQICNDDHVQAFHDIEHSRHQTDHMLIGGIMARTWGIPTLAWQAIRRHHDYTIFHDANVPESITALVAMGLIAELAIQRFARLNRSSEWDKGGEFVAGTLMLSEQDVQDWIEQLTNQFATGTD